MLDIREFLDIEKTSHKIIFTHIEYPWEVLRRLPEYISENLHPFIPIGIGEGAWIGKDVHIGEGTTVEPDAVIRGPAIIGKNCEIRHGAYIRGNVIIGDNVTIGNSSEVKNSLIFNDAAIPHFNYIGDSIVGYKANLGAGVKIANVKLTRGNIKVIIGKNVYDTNLIKFGAIIGDNAEIGCNAVLSPGSLIGKNSIIYPNTLWHGYLAPNTVVKLRQSLKMMKRNNGIE